MNNWMHFLKSPRKGLYFPCSCITESRETAAAAASGDYSVTAAAHLEKSNKQNDAAGRRDAVWMTSRQVYS